MIHRQPAERRYYGLSGSCLRRRKREPTVSLGELREKSRRSNIEGGGDKECALRFLVFIGVRNGPRFSHVSARNADLDPLLRCGVLPSGHRAS